MTTQDPRAAMHAYDEALIADVRANAGQATSGPFVGRQLALLTTIGARSGERRTSPVTYTRDGDRVIVVASDSGADSHPAWYRNVAANPIVTVEIGGTLYKALAHFAQGEERDRLYAQHASVHASFNEYVAQTSRVIPVVVLERLDEKGGAPKG